MSTFQATRGIETIEIEQANGSTVSVTIDVYVVGLALRAAAEEAVGSDSEDADYAKRIIETLERFGISVSGLTAVEVQAHILDRLGDLKKKPGETTVPASGPNSPSSTTSTPTS